MIGNSVVVDAVVHPFNMSPSNQNPRSETQVEAMYASHVRYTGDPDSPYALTREEYFTDFSFDALSRALFVESPVDFAIIHSLPNLGFTMDYVVDPRHAGAYRDLHPKRYCLYTTVDSPVTDRAIAQLEAQLLEHPADGIKLYPAFYFDGTSEAWRMDGADFGTPFIEAARDLGIRNVAVHKAVWGPTDSAEAFGVGDLGGALERFPDINFQIVHGGMAFLEETIALLKTYPNVYVTLESLFSSILVNPKFFAEVVGQMIAAVGSERLLYASGANLIHPRPFLEAFTRFQIPDELVEKMGLPKLTEADRRNMLGENALRLHGLNATTVLAGIDDDEYSRARPDFSGGPWSELRQ